MDAIMDARCPHPSQKQKTHMRYEMNRHYEQSYHVWCSLKYPVQWMGREPSKWRECVLFVVHVVGGMEMLIEKFNVMKAFVNPIHPKLNYNEVEHDVNKTEEPVELVKCRVTFGPTKAYPSLPHVFAESLPFL